MMSARWSTTPHSILSIEHLAIPRTVDDILQHYEAEIGRSATALERWAASELAELVAIFAEN